MNELHRADMLEKETMERGVMVSCDDSANVGRDSSVTISSAVHSIRFIVVGRLRRAASIDKTTPRLRTRSLPTREATI
jgi:hypothetical protein